MVAFTFYSGITIGQLGNSTPEQIDPFRNALKAVSGGAIDLDPLTTGSVSPGDSAFANVKLGAGAGGTNFAYDSPSRLPPYGNLLFFMPFGMEVQEYAAWWFSGGGKELVNGIIGAAEGLVYFPLALKTAEAGGWFKEPITLKKLQDGTYSSGEQIKIRHFGESVSALNGAFPNVTTPSPTPTVSFLGDFINGTFTAGEFNSPAGDASTVNGLFPNFPEGGGGIIEAGANHYYVSSWHTTVRNRCLFVNKAYFDGLSADDQARIEVSSRAATMQNISDSLSGQDGYLQTFQDLGATIHRELPHDVLVELRTALNKVLDDNADGDADYTAVLNSQRAFINANQVRWAHSTPDRKFRFSGRSGLWNPDLVI